MKKKQTAANRRATQAELAEEARMCEAAEKIGEAFAIFEEYADYIPNEVYNEIGTAMMHWVNESDWQSQPSLVREILPLMVGETMKNKRTLV